MRLIGRFAILVAVLLVVSDRDAVAEKVLLGTTQLEALFRDGIVFSLQGPNGPMTFAYHDSGSWKVETQGSNWAAGGWKIGDNAVCRNEQKRGGNWNGLERKKLCFPLFRDGDGLFMGSRAIPLRLEDPGVLARLDDRLPGENPAGAAATKDAAAMQAELARVRAQFEHERAKLREGGGDAAPAADIANIDWGRYHALVIGINEYMSLPKLNTALADARAVAELLREDYGYTVRLLENPTRDRIIDEFDRLRDTLTEEDNLLIYYGGHGWLDRQSGRGYWLPADAENDRRSRWLANTSLTDTLQALLARHVMVVVDSCFSGTLTRSVAVPEHNPSYFARMMEKRTRVVLSSGGLEPVVDSGGGTHSVFAAEFLKALRENQDVLDGTQLFEHVRRSVILNAQQTPQYSDIRFAGHEGGDFLFVRKR